MEAGATANYITVRYLFPSNSSPCEQLGLFLHFLSVTRFLMSMLSFVLGSQQQLIVKSVVIMRKACTLFSNYGSYIHVRNLKNLVFFLHVMYSCAIQILLKKLLRLDRCLLAEDHHRLVKCSSGMIPCIFSQVQCQSKIVRCLYSIYHMYLAAKLFFIITFSYKTYNEHLYRYLDLYLYL